MNTRVCKYLLEESIGVERKFKVHSKFEHSVNLIDENGCLITILDKTKVMMPYSIMIPFLSFVNDEEFILCDGKMMSKRKQCIDLMGFDPYDGFILGINGKVDWKRIEIHFKELDRFLKDYGSRDGMLPLVMNEKLSKINNIIYNDYCDWLHSYENRKKDFTILTQKMVGFGTGLTPSFDDLLCGLIISDLHFYKGKTDQFDKNTKNYKGILSDCKKKTNTISYHMLEMASDGLCSEAVKNLLTAFYGKQDNLESVFEKVMNFGHSSGTDILCGVYLSIKTKLKGKV